MSKTLAAIKEPTPTPGKVINLGKNLIATIAQQGEGQPYLLPIGERAEAILDAYDDRQTSTEEALKQLQQLLAEYVEAKKEHEKSGFDLNTFTIYWVLKQAGVTKPEKIAASINAVFEQFPNHAENAAELR